MARMTLDELRKPREMPRLLNNKGRNAAKSAEERQPRIALRNCGVINPENIEEYIAGGGCAALEKTFKLKTEL